jgi:DNA repair exonuclease SbcCD ATPase subunit
MRLHELRLREFRQFASLDVTFGDGLTVLIGGNDAGKSTVLEGVLWALYGTGSVRGPETSLRRLAAAADAATSAELQFSMDGATYRSRRVLVVEADAVPAEAELYDGAGKLIAAGADEVTEVVGRLTRLTRDALLHACFTGRRELQQLAQLRPAERLQLLARLLGRTAARRYPMDHALLDTVRALQQELAESDERMRALQSAPDLLAQYATELERLRPELAAAESRAELLHDEWSQKRQDVDTRLAAYRRRAEELARQIERLAAAGAAGACPACEQPLGAQLERMIARLDDEVYINTQDTKWLTQRQAQLERKPPDLAEAETRRARLRASVDDRAQRAARCEQAVQELWTVASERTRAADRLAALRTEPTATGPARDSAPPLSRADLDAVAAVAGECLARISDGRYDTIVLEDDGRVRAAVGAVTAPVVSGGDEDAIALVLRLATMRMAAVGLLILDEPFGTMDAARVRRTLELIDELRRGGTQVVLASRMLAAVDIAGVVIELDGR